MAVTTTYSLTDIRTEFAVNSNGGATPSLSNVVGLAGGGFAVAYANEDGNDDFPLLDIYASPDPGATPFNIIPVDDFAIHLQGEPVITRLTNGNVAIVWKEGAPGDQAILATIVDPVTHAVVASEAVVASFGLDTEEDPEVAALQDGSGNFVVVAKVGTSSTCVLMSPTGAFISEFEVDINIADLAVAGLVGGRFVVTYRETGGTGDVKARLFEADGTPVGGEIAVGSGDASSPQIAALKNGGFAIVYDGDSFEDTPGIALKIFDANGADQTSGGPIRVDVDLAANEFDPEIAVLDNGFILVTWTHRFSATDLDVRARVFDPNGNAIQVGGQDTFVIDQATDIDETQSSIAALVGGQFVTTWTDEQDNRISGRVQELVRTITSDGDPDVVVAPGDALRDVIHGGAGADGLRGRGGRDDHFGEAGDDLLQVADGDLLAGETYDGGDDSDMLAPFGSGASVFDFRSVSLVALEQLYFASVSGGGATARFNATQLHFASVVFEAQVTGARVVSISVDTETTLDLSGVSVTGTVGLGDRFEIVGDGNGETITGSAIADLIYGGGDGNSVNGDGDADQLHGGAGDDIFLITDATDLVSDEVYDGGDDTDTIRFSDDGGNYTYDLRTVTLTSIEALQYTDPGFNGTGTVQVDASQFGPGLSLTAGIIGNQFSDIADTLEVSVGPAASVDLSQLTMGDFGDALDRVVITGDDSDFQTIIGTAVADAINGLGGSDLLKGFGGNDVIHGGNGGDVLHGGGGKDQLFGDAGDDQVDVFAGDVLPDAIYDGGADSDLIIVHSSADFRPAAVLSLEILDLANGVTASFKAAQFGFTSVQLREGAGDTIVSLFMDTQNTLDLSGVSVSTDGDDPVAPGSRFRITGDDASETITGSSVDDTIDGGVGGDNLHGFSGNDKINGGAGGDMVNGGIGADTLNGGDDSDTYFADVVGDVVIENNANLATGGNDLVFFSGQTGTFILGNNVERLTLSNPLSGATANGTGNALANIIIGNDAINTLSGLGNNDTLDGRGGRDTLVGGDGSDTYVADVADEIVTETNAVLAAGGNDLVNFSGASGTFVLSANVERLTLTHATAATNGTATGWPTRSQAMRGPTSSTAVPTPWSTR